MEPARRENATTQAQLQRIPTSLEQMSYQGSDLPSMNDDLSERIALLEADIERLAGVADGCSKFILAAKIAIVLGGLTLLATMFGFFGFDPLVLFGSIAAILGGIVTAGSNSATLAQVQRDMRAAEQLRTALIDRIEFPS